jgi:hypothetical protein
MHLRITKSSASTSDVLRFSFESASALEIVNEYSGYAVTSARYIAYSELKQRRSQIVFITWRYL